MKYSEMDTIEPELLFETKGAILVKTTGATLHIESTNVYVHEVEITEGEGQGNKYLHNLDTAKKL